MSDQSSPKPPSNQRFNPWPWGVAALLLVVVSVNLYVWRLASDRAPIVDDPSYYQLGVTHQKQIDRRAASRALGWRARYEWSASELSLWLLNAQGQAVEGMSGALELKRADTTRSDLKVPLTMSQPGVYRADLSGQIGGLHSYQVTLSKTREGASAGEASLEWLDAGSVTLSPAPASSQNKPEER